MHPSTFEYLARERAEALQAEARRAALARRHVIPLSGPMLVYHGPGARIAGR